MKSKIVSIFLSLVMIASIFASITLNLGPLSMNASAAGSLADSPWPMFRGNLNHTGLSPYDTSGNNGTEKWNFKTGHDIRSSPAIGSDGTIYMGSQDTKLYAINPDGTEKWSFATGNVIFSSPAIGADGTVYIGSFDGGLYAVNSDGTEKWSFATGYLVQSSPAIGADGTVYVGSFDTKLYAITEAPRYSLTVSGSAGGSLTEPGAGEFIYPAGTVVSLAATPDNRYRFVNWTGDTD